MYALTSSNINRFKKSFHYQNQAIICNNTITKDPTTPQVCRYTTTHSSRRRHCTRTHWTFDAKTAGCDSYFRQ